MKRLVLVLCVFMMAASSALAHSGRTDSNGGHHDRINGGYHYHHGMPAHDHPGGVCPYYTPTSTPTPRPTATPRPTYTPSPTPKPTATPKKYTYYISVRTTANLNLRNGPSTKHDVLLTIPKGSTAVYLESDGNWLKVNYTGKKGWVHSDYVEPATPAPFKPVATYVQSKSSEKSQGGTDIKGPMLALAAMVSIPALVVMIHEKFR